MDKREPFFSICIPNYNYAHHIAETIDSVLGQTFCDFEIIIQDNASTDDSWEVIQNYVARDTRIRAFKNNHNIGFAPNLNKVVRNAKGEFIITLSSDDVMMNSALEEYFNLIINCGENRDNIIVCSNALIIDQNGNRGGVLRKIRNLPVQKTIITNNIEECNLIGEIEKIDGVDLLLKGIEHFSVPGIFCATCFSRSLFERVNGYDEGYYFCPDFGFLLKILSKNPHYFWLHESLFKYRIHRDNQLFNQKKSFNLMLELDGLRSLRFLLDNNVINQSISYEKIVNSYLKNICIKNSFALIIKNKFGQALRPILFGISNYPREIFSIGQFYICFLSILFFPITFSFVKIYFLVKKLRDNDSIS
jgi:glycosyltransferase involved in cell wall biosynthesis